VIVPERSMGIVNAGLVTSVGWSAPTACAAIRAAITNHTETRFMNGKGEWIVAAQVPLPDDSRGLVKLAKLLGMAIDECLAPFGALDRKAIPLLLCVAEEERVGRLDGLDSQLIAQLEADSGLSFHPHLSATLPYGRVGAAVALGHARQLIFEGTAEYVLIAASDSLLVGRTLALLEAEGRLLMPENSNGFVPGEASGAILVTRRSVRGPRLVCEGLGFAREPASINSEQPLRGDGLTKALTLALVDSGRAAHDLDFRITDLSGDQYYFKEADLAITRTLRQRKTEFDLWHPADCIGETGAAIGIVALTVALTACQKGYAPGPCILFHAGNDAGQRAAAVLQYEPGT
jgi:3-oxoacyl-[acyl-carrier-protein] synthase-1